MVSLEKEVAAASALSGGSGDTDPMNLLSSEFQEKIQQLEIAFFAALHYIQEHGGSVKGAQQALCILQSCVFKIEEAVEFAQ